MPDITLFLQKLNDADTVNLFEKTAVSTRMETIYDFFATYDEANKRLALSSQTGEISLPGTNWEEDDEDGDFNYSDNIISFTLSFC